MLLCVWTTVLLFRTAWSYQQYGKMFALHCISVAIKIWWHEKSFVLRTPLSLTLSLPLSLSPHCVCSSLPPLSLPSLSLCMFLPPTSLSLSHFVCSSFLSLSPPPPPPLSQSHPGDPVACTVGGGFKIQELTLCACVHVSFSPLSAVCSRQDIVCVCLPCVCVCVCVRPLCLIMRCPSAVDKMSVYVSPRRVCLCAHASIHCVYVSSWGDHVSWQCPCTSLPFSYVCAYPFFVSHPEVTLCSWQYPCISLSPFYVYSVVFLLSVSLP